MARNILVSVAWPYASANIHVGNLGGAYLPADIYARFHRLRGDRVLMVSGSDSHGTPITVAADAEGASPREVFERYHQRFLDLFVAMGLTYDLFTHTDTENHHRVSQDIFLALLENGFLTAQTKQQLYSVSEGRFLPDRYVEGTCPICGYDGARGDQCDNCGNLMDALELIDPRSRTDGSTPETRETEHFYLDLSALGTELGDWLADGKDFWRPQVLNFARNMVRDGLQPRPITRDLDWGIPVPDAEGHVIYVCFDALLNYISAIGYGADEEKFRHLWPADVHVIGKDITKFHTALWPAMLRSAGVEPPHRVFAHGFLHVGGRKMGKSLGNVIDPLEIVRIYGPEALRYALLRENDFGGDGNYDPEAIHLRYHSDLANGLGNLVNRTLLPRSLNDASGLPGTRRVYPTATTVVRKSGRGV